MRKSSVAEHFISTRTSPPSSRTPDNRTQFKAPLRDNTDQFTVPDDPILNVDELVDNYDSVEVPDSYIDLACHESSFSNSSSDEDCSRNGHRKHLRKRMKISHDSYSLNGQDLDTAGNGSFSLDSTLLDASLGFDSLYECGVEEPKHTPDVCSGTGVQDGECTEGEGNSCTTTDLLSQSSNLDSMTLEMLLPSQSSVDSLSVSLETAANLTSSSYDLSPVISSSQYTDSSTYALRGRVNYDSAAADGVTRSGDSLDGTEDADDTVDSVGLTDDSILQHRQSYLSDEGSSAVLDSSVFEADTNTVRVVSADNHADLWDLEISGNELLNPFDSTENGPNLPTIVHPAEQVAQGNNLDHTFDSLENLSLYSSFTGAGAEPSIYSDQTVPTSSDDEVANALERISRRRRELNSCSAQLVPDIDYIEE